MSFYRIFKHLCLFVLLLQRYSCTDLTYTIEEGKSPGTFIGDISADSLIAKDHEGLSSIRFSQLKQGVSGSSQLFKVSKKTGKLYTLETLDAEVLCKRNEECFQMLDVAIQKASSTIKILEIKIFIQDINDHQPQFPQKQINIMFGEDVRTGMKKYIPNAIDKDVGVVNSQITYELKKHRNKPFSLIVSKSVDGTSKLSINLDEPIDREVKDSYMIRVVAKDGGSPAKQNTLDIHITITDVNDNIPTFSQKIFNVSIKNEPSDTIPITVMVAKDLDSEQNGKIAYSFSSQTAINAKEFFKINDETGEIYLYNKLTLGQMMIPYLYIEAKDGGTPPLSSIAKLMIKVIDQQNNAPIIKINFASTSKENTVDIFEDIKIGNFIAYVKVTDHDEGQNGEVTCHIHHDMFKLQDLGTKKYEVTLKNPLDREKAEHHDVVISCQDKGSPPLHSNSKFSIQVMDINDVKPQFTKDTFKFLIDENEKSRITVGYINATDPDLGAGGKLTYSLITNNKYFLPFKISPNGLLSAIMSLDHEFQDTYDFQVFVKDNGTPSLNNTVNVIVKVTDKNDNGPYFTFPSVKPYNMDVTYYPHQTKNITQIKASDSDSQENAFLKYQIIRGNDKQMFTMNQYTGLLAFNRQMRPENAGSYQLDIVVKDSGSPILSATTTLFLTLTISNKTSQMLNVIELESKKKVHLNLVIIITVIAVTIAVFITASLSICIIRCNGQPNVAYAQALDPSNRYVGEQRQLIAPSYQQNSWSRPTHTLAKGQTLARNTFMTESRRQLMTGQKSEGSSEPSSQLYTKNVSIPPDYFAWRSARTLQPQGEVDWTNRNNGHCPERTDPCPTKTPFQVGHLSKSDISSPYPQSRNLVETNDQQTSNSRPLPPVPLLYN